MAQDPTDARFDRLEKALFEYFEKIDARFEKIDARFDKIEARLDKAEADMRTLTTYVLDFRTEITKRLDLMESRISIFADTSHSIDMRMPGLTRAIAELQVRMEKLNWPPAA